jgi:O-antigen/teichoic acid export membrane protein
MSYFKNALQGFGWQTALKILTALITLLKISILARLLNPDAFGLFSLTVIALGLSEAAAQTGVNITILQSKKSVAYFLDTAWVISIIRGLLIAIWMILIGFGMKFYFDSPQLIILVALASLIPVIKGFINPSIIIMRKNLYFFKDSLYRFVLALAEGLLAILFGFWLKSVEALILSLIGAALIEVLISFSFFDLRPKFRYLKSRASIIFSNAKWLSLSSLLGYLNDNLDDLVLGKMFGTYSLGLYHNAYALTHKANYDLAKSINHGTLPIYTKIANDKKRLLSATFKTFGWSSLLLLMTSSLLILFPQLLVEIILGPQWLAAVPMIKWLALAGVVHSLALLGYTFFLATASYKFLNLHQVINLIATISLIIVGGLKAGLIGSIIGLSIGRALALPIIFYGIYQHHKKNKI